MHQTLEYQYENLTLPENSNSPRVTKEKRIIYTDILRIVATFFVIVVHFSSDKVNTIPVHDSYWEYFNCFHGLSRWCVPIFFMLSGMFFLNPQKQITVKNIFRKYIFRIVSALVFWGALYYVLTIYWASITGVDTLSFTKIIQFPRYIIFGPPYYHLWYLYAITGLYLMTPVLRILTANMTRKHIEYWLLLFIITGSLIPTINHYLSDINTSYRISFGIAEFNGYTGYFIAGYYFSRYELTSRSKKSLYITAVLLAVLSLIVTSHLSILANKPDRLLYGYSAPNIIAASFGLFVAFKTFFKRISFSEQFTGYIHYVSKLTFGIFLIHPLFLKILSLYNIDAASFFPLFSIPVLSGGVFIISALCIAVLKKIPVFEKYLT